MLGVESDSLLQSEATRNSRKLVFLSFGVAVVAIILGLSISAIVLSVKAVQDKKIEAKVNDCYYTETSNNYTVPKNNPGYATGVTLIQGGTVWTGIGNLYSNYDILIIDGKISAIGPSPLANVPAGAVVYPANGAFITPDMHSHAGVYALPEDAHGTSDGNEATNPTTPQVRTIDAIDPNDPAIPLILSGGVTTSLILPGSANLIGGEAYPVKMKGGSVANMTIPNTPRYFKMATGENPKNVYGNRGVLPSTRMGNISFFFTLLFIFFKFDCTQAWGFRRIFSQASDLKLQQDQWDCIQQKGEAQQDKRPYSAELEPLVAILRGQALVNIHCYEVQDFEAILRVADEFGFKVAAFHHALEAYRIPYVFGPRNITIATFSDHWGFKMEGYDASVNNPSILTQNGVNVALKSDHPVLFAKFLSLEAVKAHHYGLSVDDSLKAITVNPANALGLGDRVGTLEVGKDGDVVIWDKHPLVLGARPTKVFIEGVLKVNNPSVFAPSVSPPTFSDKTLVSSPNACVNPSGSYYVQGGTMYTMNNLNMTTQPIVVVTNGIISCVGDINSCTIPAGIDSYSLDGGYIIPGIISAASTVGMNEIDQEALSGDGFAPIDNGANIFAADGIRLEGKKVWATWAGGVTVQIAKPEASSLISGVSAAFYTHGTIANDALLVEKLALHITIGNNAKLTTQTSSVSGQFAMLRSIFKASTTGADPTDPVYQVLNGTLPVVFNVDQADEIGAVLRLVRDYKLTNVTIVGGAEASVIASQIQAAGVSVVLAPVQAYPSTFETQRASDLASSILVNASVNFGVAEFDAGSTRNLRWNAGQTLSQGVGYPQALASITSNLARAFNLPFGTGTISVGTKANFVLYDGDPLVTGSKVAAVALGTFVQCNPQQL